MTKDPDALRRQIEASQERVSRLCGAILRISASLDIGAVLQEVVDSARALTDARYGVITTVDEAGRPRQFLSSGITPEEHRQIVEWADGLELFEHLRGRPGGLTVGDLPAYIRSLGLSADMLPYKALHGTPIHHRGVHVGSLFLTEKEGGREFTDEDEEVLVLCASHGGGGDRPRPRLPGRAACESEPGGPGRHLAGRRGGLRRQDRPISCR